eukprot:1948781-Amphidinium_carterae.1
MVWYASGWLGKECSRVPDADSLYLLKINVGDPSPRQVRGGILRSSIVPDTLQSARLKIKGWMEQRPMEIYEKHNWRNRESVRDLQVDE